MIVAVSVPAWIDLVNTLLGILLFALGLLGLLTRRNVIKQIICLKIMLQGIALELLHAGLLNNSVHLAQAMVISALIVESVVMVAALAIIVNLYQHYPSGDVDDLNRLSG